MNLVTGATGLVGSHVLLALLKQGKPVVAMKRTGSDTAKVEKLFSHYTPDYKTLFDSIKWVEADLADVFSIERALDGIKVVYHCAGFISFDENDHDRLIKINAEGTANMVNACLTKTISAFCHVSSVATLQNADVKNEVDETVLWKPGSRENSYAVSKYLAEQEVWRAAEEGLQTVIVNPGVIFGPGSWEEGSGRLFKLGHKGTRYYTEGVTGFVDAADVAEIMIMLTEQKKFAARYIIVENNYSFKEVLEMIHRGFNRPLP
ncbi:MAG: SDR family NAD(P)-dependent oxidoreductase, partial [Bacteroidia bacterium]